MCSVLALIRIGGEGISGEPEINPLEYLKTIPACLSLSTFTVLQSVSADHCMR